MGHRQSACCAAPAQVVAKGPGRALQQHEACLGLSWQRLAMRCCETDLFHAQAIFPGSCKWCERSPAGTSRALFHAFSVSWHTAGHQQAFDGAPGGAALSSHEHTCRRQLHHFCSYRPRRRMLCRTTVFCVDISLHCSLFCLACNCGLSPTILSNCRDCPHAHAHTTQVLVRSVTARTGLQSAPAPTSTTPPCTSTSATWSCCRCVCFLVFCSFHSFKEQCCASMRFDSHPCAVCLTSDTVCDLTMRPDHVTHECDRIGIKH